MPHQARLAKQGMIEFRTFMTESSHWQEIMGSRSSYAWSTLMTRAVDRRLEKLDNLGGKRKKEPRTERVFERSKRKFFAADCGDPLTALEDSLRARQIVATRLLRSKTRCVRGRLWRPAYCARRLASCAALKKPVGARHS